MEVNKDEAERCIEISIAAIKTGNIDRAEKFLRKAENLFPTQRAKALLARLHTTKTAKPDTAAGNTTTRKRKPAEEEPAPKLNVDYSSEQLEMVRRIKRCKDHYEVLGITKESTDSDIKKAYKKLALQLHPDKNRAPGAVEAFKAVGNAMATLTDPEKRKTYDLYGADASRSSSHMRQEYHRHNAPNGYAYNMEGDFSADDLFNMFFGGGFPTNQRMNQTNNRRYQQQRPEQGAQQPSLAFGLILVLIVVSMLSSFFTSDPVYNLSQTSRYPMRRNTIHLNIPYYVKDNFENDYQGSLARLENSVEEEYIASMKQACYRERSYREVMIARARSFGNHVHLEQAQNMKVPSCENLSKLGLSKYLPY